MPASEPPPDASPDPIWTEDGAPRSARFGDVYFSGDDGLAESRAVFLEGCDLPEAWAGRDRFTVAELGFGTGLNIVALLDLWRRKRPGSTHLNIFSVEAFPLTADEARRALSAWPELTETVETLTTVWPRGTPGFHRIDLAGLNVTLDLAVGDAVWALKEWTGCADAWFLDGFSPALNPGMWSAAVLDLVAARSAPGARLATFTVAGSVRRGLAERGFRVDRRPGHGRKRERLEARLPGSMSAGRLPTVAVIGAGIAGASVVHALTAAGATPVLIEGEARGAGASGFPSALVTPRLDVGDDLIAGFYAQALERARDLYRQTPEAILCEGVLQLEQSARDGPRFARIAAQPLWVEGEMTPVDSREVTDRTGEPGGSGGLIMDGGLAIRPTPLLDAWLAGAQQVPGMVARLEQAGNVWRILDDDGTLLIEADAVVVACGWGAARLLPALGLQAVRGQAEWVEGVAAAPVAWGGYIAPTGQGLLYGATHDRDDEGVDVRPRDSERNLQTLAVRLPGLAGVVRSLPCIARAAVRATTRDRLPLCGGVTGRPGVFVLCGLGSRGFCVAPLLGEHLAALLCDRPSPLPAAFAERLSPDRFGVDSA